jgi:hypothetical protein
MKSFSNDIVTPQQIEKLMDNQQVILNSVEKVTKIAIITVALISITLIGVAIGVAKLFL